MYHRLCCFSATEHFSVTNIFSCTVRYNLWFPCMGMFDVSVSILSCVGNVWAVWRMRNNRMPLVRVSFEYNHRQIDDVSNKWYVNRLTFRMVECTRAETFFFRLHHPNGKRKREKKKHATHITFGWSEE